MTSDQTDSGDFQATGSTVYLVQMPDGQRHHLVSMLPEGVIYGADAIPKVCWVGSLTGEPGEGADLKADDFIPNADFVALLQRVVAETYPTLPGLVSEAEKQQRGWLYVLDARTPDPAGDVPQEDIVGAFQVQDGKIDAAGYEANPEHALFTGNGFFRLAPDAEAALIERLMKAVEDYAAASR